MSSHIGQLLQLLGHTLNDGNVTICLHSGRVIEALGNSMQQCLQEQGKMPSPLNLWQWLIRFTIFMLDLIH
jgi:hypothetical protein